MAALDLRSFSWLGRRPRASGRVALAVAACFALFVVLVWWRQYHQLTAASRRQGERDDAHAYAGGVVAVPRTPGGRRLRVLFLTHKTATFDKFMDRYFVYQYRSAHRHPHVEAVMWGIDFRGYDNTLTLRQNLVQRFGAVYFDIVFLFGGARNHELVEISGETAIMIREHECWGRRCAPYLQWNNVSIGMFAFAQEMHTYLDESHRRLLVHSPTSAYTPYFYSGVPVDREPAAARSIGVSMQGAATESVYPLRARFVRMINDGLLGDVYMRKHPGYDLGEGGGPEPDDPDGESHALDRQVRDYASVMKQSKICLMDSSRYKYAIQKYAEAAVAGCLIVGDLPMERNDDLRRFVVEVRASDSDEHIASVVRWWLEHDEERMQRAAVGQRVSLAKYTWDAWTNDVLIESYNLWRAGQFGLWHPYPFSITCAAESVREGKFANAWCV